MQELKHALTGGIYGIDPADGLVRVEEAGQVGWFDYRGRWQRGDVFQARSRAVQLGGRPRRGRVLRQTVQDNLTRRLKRRP